MNNLKLTDFCSSKFDEIKAFKPLFPINNEEIGGVIYFKSLKSKDAQKVIDGLRQKEARKTGVKTFQDLINEDITISCAVVDSIDGFIIEPEDNSVGFDLDGNKVISNRKNIRILLEKFPFIRNQLAMKANDDELFYLG